MAKTVKIGMMSFAHVHAPSYAECLRQLPDVEFVGIADDDPARAKQMARLFKTKAFGKYEELLASDVDGIIVCSETANHRKHAVTAAQSEKHVLCEKPLATTMHDAEAIVEVCKRSGVKLMTAFPCRYHPAFVRLKAACDSGDLGKILAIKATNQGKCPGGWFIDKSLSGGGAVMDHTVHLVDLMRYLLNAEPGKIYAEVDNRMFGNDFDDTAVITIDFNNGVFATIDASWSRPKSYPIWGNVNMDVTGTEGIAHMEMLAQTIDVYTDRKNGQAHTHEYWGDNTDMSLVGAFVKSIADGTDVDISGTDGLKALEVAMAAYESAKSREVVDLLS